MLYLYNNDTDTFSPLYRTAFENLDEMINPQEEVDSSVFNLVFFASITDIFTIAKRRSSFRGRFAKDGNGNSLIDNLAITDDERDWYDDILPVAAAEVCKKLSAYAKNVSNAYKYNVTFGEKSASGIIESVTDTVITDNTLSLTPSALTGHKLVITSGDIINQKKTIIDNTETTITLQEAWEQDITGLSYNVYTPSDDYVMYSVQLDDNWDSNMLQLCDNAILESLVTYVLKEWYLTHRYIDDYTIEEGKYQKQLSLVKTSLGQGKKPYRRPTDFFI